MGAALAVALLTLSEAAAATSLWAKAEAEGSRPTSLFADARARRVGDLVTIVIVEQAEASSTATTGASSEGKVNVGPGQGLLQGLIPLIGGSGTTRYDGSGRTQRTGRLRAQMTARVTEVLPGGALRLEGRQTIRVNDEDQEMVLTGVVRPEDIGRDNTVLSTYLAEARITFRGSGALGSRTKPGILSRLFGWLF